MHTVVVTSQCYGNWNNISGWNTHEDYVQDVMLVFYRIRYDICVYFTAETFLFLSIWHMLVGELGA